MSRLILHRNEGEPEVIELPDGATVSLRYPAPPAPHNPETGSPTERPNVDAHGFVSSDLPLEGVTAISFEPLTEEASEQPPPERRKVLVHYPTGRSDEEWERLGVHTRQESVRIHVPDREPPKPIRRKARR